MPVELFVWHRPAVFIGRPLDFGAQSLYARGKRGAIGLLWICPGDKGRRLGDCGQYLVRQVSDQRYKEMTRTHRQSPLTLALACAQ
jgi:hypothetical protein